MLLTKGELNVRFVPEAEIDKAACLISRERFKDLMFTHAV